LTSILARRSSTWESTTAPNARRNMKPKCTFINFSFYVILLFGLLFLVLSRGRYHIYVMLLFY
jgi:hypothetical protein